MQQLKPSRWRSHFNTTAILGRTFPSWGLLLAWAAGTQSSVWTCSGQKTMCGRLRLSCLLCKPSHCISLDHYTLESKHTPSGQASHVTMDMRIVVGFMMSYSSYRWSSKGMSCCRERRLLGGRLGSLAFGSQPQFLAEQVKAQP